MVSNFMIAVTQILTVGYPDPIDGQDITEVEDVVDVEDVEVFDDTLQGHNNTPLSDNERMSVEDSDESEVKVVKKEKQTVVMAVKESRLKTKGQAARLRVEAHRTVPVPGDKRKADIHTSPKKQ
jgi:hypothetical protein